VSDWPIEKIIPYPNNPRTHPADQVSLLAKLISKHGVDQPIVVDEEGFILKGHGRRMAAVEAGLKSFPVVQHLGLSDDDKRAIRLADNQVALLSGWNEGLLRAELTDLKAAGYEMNLLGFSDVQLVSFMANVPTGADPEATPEPPVDPVSRIGDMWQLGKHRLLCGDSTSKTDVEVLVGDDRPNLLVSDPPYGVNYDPNWRNEPQKLNLKSTSVMVGKVLNDDRADWTETWKLFKGNVAYVWCGERQSVSMAHQLEEAGLLTRNLIVWGKTHLVISRGHYHPQHETCWYAVRESKSADWTGDRAQSTLWTIENLRQFGRSKEGDEKTGHGTQKPVECMRRPILNNSVPGAFVYEPFSGSGTTIIACEMTSRYCLAIELNPAYVDVAVQRWQEFAKAEATLIGDGRTYAEIAKARKKAPRRSSGAPGKAKRAQAAE
jgi:DNA modification methylase